MGAMAEHRIGAGLDRLMRELFDEGGDARGVPVLVRALMGVEADERAFRPVLGVADIVEDRLAVPVIAVIADMGVAAALDLERAFEEGAEAEAITWSSPCP